MICFCIWFVDFELNKFLLLLCHSTAIRYYSVFQEKFVSNLLTDIWSTFSYHKFAVLVPLKLWSNGAIQICYYYYYYMVNIRWSLVFKIWNVREFDSCQTNVRQFTKIPNSEKSHVFGKTLVAKFTSGATPVLCIVAVTTQFSVVCHYYVLPCMP